MSIISSIGLAFIIIGFYFFFDALIQSKRCREKTMGKIVILEERFGLEMPRMWGKYYVPVYEFEADGHTYRVAGKEYNKYSEWFEIGAVKEIRYNPNNPEDCIINNRNGKTGVGIVFCILGVFMMFIGKR